MMKNYVHGYSKRESERLEDQADTLSAILHHDTQFPPGSKILEAGCGVGAQTIILAKNSPEAKITSIDISENSLITAKNLIDKEGIKNVQFKQADIMDLPFAKESFDYLFVCFVLGDKMKISVILAHPYENSFNHALYVTVLKTLKSNGHEVRAHDLYLEEFKPLIKGKELVNGETSDPLVIQHRKEIKEAEGIIIIHPNWWGQPPAILKGWTDRVLRSGVAYEFDDDDDGSGVPRGLLKAKSALVFNTSNTPEKREMGIFGDPLERIWKDCVFDFCGITQFYRKMFRVVASSTFEERKNWLDEVKIILNEYFP